MKIPLRIVLFATLLSAAHAEPVNGAIQQRMDEFITNKEIAGAVTLVADPDKVLHLSANGMLDTEAFRPMAIDTVFWIASMTKPITATAVMMMAEEGKLSVDDPVSKYLPEFAELKNGSGKPMEITIKQCLTHSSGLADLQPNEQLAAKTLEEAIKMVAKKPLQFDPGTKWQYCQSGINTVARIVEVVSGKNFADFLQERLFTPLGMKDTGFYPDKDQLGRCASSYERTEEGTLRKVFIPYLPTDPATGEKSFPRANGGLFSTAPDYAKFTQMILREGELNGKRYLKPESVKQMTSVQSGNLTTGFTPGNGWGLGWCVVRQPQGVSEALSPGSFGHGGLFGTQAWIDPVRKRAYILLVQRSNFPNSDNSVIRRAFQNEAAK